jgi:hypothetical protein
MPDHRSLTPMNATEFSKILLVQALEESDPHGHHLPLSTRHHATQQARDQDRPLQDHSPEGDFSFLIKRTEIIFAFVKKAFPALAQSWDRLQVNIPSALVAIPAMGAGLLINGLGESQRVNLLNFPLLLLLLWNFGIYLSTALMPLLKSSFKTTCLDTAASWLSKMTGIWGQRPWHSMNLSDPSTVPWVQEATQRFMALWWPHVQPVWTQQLRQLLHLGAACMALGIVLGLYIRGLALDYQATWESTFLSANQVQVLLHTLLGPAAWVLSYPFPDVSGIVNLHAPQHGPAAPWIHMWAVTALTVIVIPRIIMSWMCQRSLNQARETFILPLDDPYFVHLLAPDRGQGVHVDIMPYSYHPSPVAKHFLDLGFLDLFGNLATIQWQSAMPFGQEIPTWPEVSTLTRTFVVIFNAGQTPEGEVQGEWLHTIQTQMDTSRPGSRLLVLLDEEPYGQTVEKTRVIDRRQAWQRLCKQYHLQIVPLDPSTTSQDQFLQQTLAGLWPASG